MVYGAESTVYGAGTGTNPLRRCPGNLGGWCRYRHQPLALGAVPVIHCMYVAPNPESTVYGPESIVYGPESTVYGPESTVYGLDSTL